MHFFRSGPVETPFAKEILACDIRISSLSGAVGYGGPQTYTGLPIQNSGCATKSWTK
jgi:hypothetical protein